MAVNSGFPSLETFRDMIKELSNMVTLSVYTTDFTTLHSIYTGCTPPDRWMEEVVKIKGGDPQAKSGVVSEYNTGELRRMFPIFESTWLMNEKLWILALEVFYQMDKDKEFVEIFKKSAKSEECTPYELSKYVIDCLQSIQDSLQQILETSQ